MRWLVWLKLFANKYSGGWDVSSNVADKNVDDILEFDPLTGQWKLVDRMIQGRSNHAVAVINSDSGLCVV